MYREQADGVSGKKGRLELAPWVSHPPHCVCSKCPRYRAQEAAKQKKPLAEIWEQSIDIRLRRLSPHPRDRAASSAAATLLKEAEEKRLRADVATAEAERRARLGAVSFGAAVAAYRDYLIKGGHEYRRSKCLINWLEKFIGAGLDIQAVDYQRYTAVLEAKGHQHPETQRHYASMLLAILNNAKAVALIKAHQLEFVRVPSVPRDNANPTPWTWEELAVIMGPALREYERQQAEWNAKVALEKKNRSKRCPSYVPMRGYCLQGYYMLVRPGCNLALTWEELTLDEATRTGRFELKKHKNQRKGISARGPLAPELVDYLLSIRPPNATGPVHVNPDTGKPYIEIRKQWYRVLDIAEKLLAKKYPGFKFTAKKRDFFNFRHTGASHIAQQGKDPQHLLAVVKMMGDTSLATVNRHYFNLDDEKLQGIVAGWKVPDVASLFGADHPRLIDSL